MIDDEVAALILFGAVVLVLLAPFGIMLGMALPPERRRRRRVGAGRE